MIKVRITNVKELSYVCEYVDLALFKLMIKSKDIQIDIILKKEQIEDLFVKLFKEAEIVNMANAKIDFARIIKEISEE